MLKIFGRKSGKGKDDKKNVLNLESPEPVDCLCDFTFNFHWQHKVKTRLTMESTHNNLTFGDVVEHLKMEEMCILMEMLATGLVPVWV